MKTRFALIAVLLPLSVLGDSTETKTAPAPTADRVGFPKGYQEQFTVLRIVNKANEHKVVTVYGNQQAASITNATQLPYPYGSILVMESARTTEDAQGKAVQDAKGNLVKGQVTGLHVMRREQGFGEAYGANRSGEWEYVEYKPDGTYITSPQKSASCAECHVKAGAKRDFVYQARLGGDTAR
jgi:hypothetical protein